MKKTIELLRVTLTADSIRQACEEYADRRASGSVSVNGAYKTIGVPGDLVVTVIVTKKRVRKAKGAPNAG